MKKSGILETNILMIDKNHSYKSYEVTKATKYGTFNESVNLHSEDEDICGDMIGFNLAERKCDIKAYGRKVANFKQRLIEAEHIYKVACASCGEDSETVKFVERQRNLIKRDYEKMYNNYVNARDGYKDYAEKYLNKVRAMKKFVDEHRASDTEE